MFESAKHYVQTNSPPTGDDGIFILQSKLHWSTSHFTLSCTNHITCYGISGEDAQAYVYYSEESEPRTNFFGDDTFKGEFSLKGTISTSTKSNGFNIIVMRPR